MLKKNKIIDKDHTNIKPRHIYFKYKNKKNFKFHYRNIKIAKMK